MTLEIRFFYQRGKGEENSILLQIYENGKPTEHTLVTQHLSGNHPHEIWHNHDSPDRRFIGVGLKYKIMDEETDQD